MENKCLFRNLSIYPGHRVAPERVHVLIWISLSIVFWRLFTISFKCYTSLNTSSLVNFLDPSWCSSTHSSSRYCCVSTSVPLSYFVVYLNLDHSRPYLKDKCLNGFLWVYSCTLVHFLVSIVVYHQVDTAPWICNYLPFQFSFWNIPFLFAI